jgi:hypothetical protein
MSAFPVVFLFSQNVYETPLSEISLPLLMLISISTCGWLILRFLVRDGRKAGLIVSLTILLFFSFGHFRDLIFGWKLLGQSMGQPRYLFGLWLIVFVAGSVAMLKARKNLSTVTRLFNIAAITLVAMSTATAGFGMLTRSSIEGSGNAPSQLTHIPDSRPDIYYMILDGYGREDVLKEIHNFDNSEFTGYLRDRGFFVADSSTTNYCQTFPSLASSLNMTYLDDIAEKVGPEFTGKFPLIRMIKDSRVVHILREAGYSIVAFSSALESLEIDDPDVFMGDNLVLTEFQNVLLASTPLRRVFSKLPSQDGSHRRQLSNTLDHLARTPNTGTPKFVYAHVLAPHPPFVFDESGDEVNPDHPLRHSDGSHYMKEGGSVEEYKKGYSQFTEWLNGKLVAAIDSIIAGSDELPIIILQADHGPGSGLDWDDISNTNLAERMSILNAYLLPGECRNGIYNEITPVNTFRFVFDCYFGTDFGFLEDANYFSLWNSPYQFTNVTDELHEPRSEVHLLRK